jgi:chromosome partitioning protein
MVAQPVRFAALFEHPTVEAMHGLANGKEFERFVAYVLRRAGYDAKEVGVHWLRGVDLEMRRPGYSRIVGGVECKRFQSTTLVDAKIVGNLLGAAAVSGAGARPYVFTTSDFHPNAHKKAKAGAKKAYLMNGEQLVRYITYVRGSRYDDQDRNTLLSPENFCDLKPPLTAFGAAKVLTVANNKGGVGKTTTAYFLGAEFARQGKRVLLIDLDGQANLTERCLPELLETDGDGIEHLPSITQYFAGTSLLSDLIVSAGRPRMSIVPSDPFLSLRDPGGSGRPEVEIKFVQNVRALSTTPIASLGGVPDWIIIDTPPALSVFTRAGLAAAQYVLAPVRPRTASVSGTTNMLKTLQTMRALTGESRSTFLGAVITHWDGLKVSQNFEDQVLPFRLRGHGGHHFETKIPIDNQLEELEPGAKLPGPKAYEALAAEVTRYVEAWGVQTEGPTPAAVKAPISGREIRDNVG